MATLQLIPHSNEFERVQTLSEVAKILLDIRIVCCLLVTLWLAWIPELHAVALALVAASAWLLLVLLRWESFGLTLCTHPFILAADAIVCLFVLHFTEPMSPMLLVLGSGAVLSGLCLGRRGAWVFAPVLAGGWWFVFSFSTPESLRAEDSFNALVVVPVLLVGSLFLGTGIREVILRAAEIERDRRRQNHFAGVAEERARLAREMHDSLVKTLHGVALLADTLPTWLERSPARARQHAAAISDQLLQASKDSRALVLAMRRARGESGVAEQVPEAVERWSLSTGRRTAVHVSGEPDLSTESTYELVALLNEALENVARHTPPTAGVEVRLAESPGWVELTVCDDGPGTDLDLNGPGSPRPGHFGVTGMRERAARVGGSLRFTSSSTGPTTVHVRLPAALPDEEEWY